MLKATVLQKDSDNTKVNAFFNCAKAVFHKFNAHL